MEGGKLLRVTYYSLMSTTWTKKDDVGYIVSKLVGGGGGLAAAQNAAAGGTTSFGSHHSATGGKNGWTSGGTTPQNGAAGTGVGGDVNISGCTGFGGVLGTDFTLPGYGGTSVLGFPGRGSDGTGARGGGGAGGYSEKRIEASDLANTETVTIGGVGAGSFNGQSGVVIIEEYSK